MARTADSLVRAIVAVPADISLQVWVDDAALIVDAVIPADTHSEELMERIETYIAAHLWITSGNSQTKSEKVGPIAESFAINTGKYLEGSTYGQNALALDTSGKLAAYQDNLAKGRAKRKRGVTHLGADPRGVTR